MIRLNIKPCRFNRNTLKIIAALSMLMDHIGVILYPNIEFLRIIGRISFPIYAYMIAEGCTYTKNKLRYFLTIFTLGALCQIVYYLYDAGTYMGILITFSLSILTIYAMQYLKETLLDVNSRLSKRCISILIFLSVIIGIYVININFEIDYGFWGCMTPVLVSIFRKPKSSQALYWKKLDSLLVHIIMLTIGLILVAYELGGRQPYSLLAIPLLMLYSGKNGKWKMKTFFYIFYPLHLAILELISWFLQNN